MDGTIERGYAGASIFWHDEDQGYAVTEKDKNLWREYARANASIGINGAVLNNVNASQLMLTTECSKNEVLLKYGSWL
jgi:alpha-glucuronidase